MAIKFSWIRSVRGLTPIERNVLTYLSERADNDTGITPQGVFARTIAIKCETTQNNVFKVLRVLEDKGFLKSRTVRKAHANRYALNLASYRPKNHTAGQLVWGAIVARLKVEMPIAELHAQHSDAWFNKKTRTLTVWLDSDTGLDWAKTNVKKIAKTCHTNRPPISWIELLRKTTSAEIDS